MFFFLIFLDIYFNIIDSTVAEIEARLRADDLEIVIKMSRLLKIGEEPEDVDEEENGAERVSRNTRIL